MEIININKKSIPDEALSMIPREFYPTLTGPEVMIYGAEFMDELCGVLVWKQVSEKAGSLFSINVSFEARQLGLGRGLVESMLSDAAKMGVKEIDFGFTEDDDDKEILTAFLYAMGAVTDSISYPLGLVTIRHAMKALLNNNIVKRADGYPRCQTFEELSPAGRNVLLEWIRKNTDIPALIYTEESPCLAVIHGMEVRGAMLFKELSGGDLSLEYCYQAPGEAFALASMLHRSCEILTNYPPSASLRMILANGSSKKLYSTFFNQPEDEITICRGFIPV